jgi:hypothetical protein
VRRLSGEAVAEEPSGHGIRRALAQALLAGTASRVLERRSSRVDALPADEEHARTTFPALNVAKTPIRAARAGALPPKSQRRAA